MRNIYVSGGLREKWQRIWVGEEDLNLLKGNWRNIFVWTIGVIVLIGGCWLVRLIFDITGLDSEINDTLFSWVNTEIIL